MTKKTTYKTTEKGLKKLMTELKKREGELREKIKDAIAEAMSQGDLSENEGYDMSIEEQRSNEKRIDELKDKIGHSEIVACDTTKVNLGCKVTLQGEKDVTYEITGEEEANPLEGKISYLSPIGSAVMGKKIGKKVKISTPQGKTTYKISKID